MQVVAEQQFSQESNVYLLGIVLWEMLSWQIPRQGLTCSQVQLMFTNTCMHSLVTAGCLHVIVHIMMCMCCESTVCDTNTATQHCRLNFAVEELTVAW